MWTLDHTLAGAPRSTAASLPITMKVFGQHLFTIMQGKIFHKEFKLHLTDTRFCSRNVVEQSQKRSNVRKYREDQTYASGLRLPIYIERFRQSHLTHEEVASSLKIVCPRPANARCHVYVSITLTTFLSIWESITDPKTLIVPRKLCCKQYFRN